MTEADLPTPYYQDDHVTIYHGDCLDMLPLLEFDVIVTDPPYGISWSKGQNNARSSRAHSGIVNDDDTAHRDAVLAMVDVPSVVFGSVYKPLPPAGVRHVLIWQKPNDAGVVGSTTGFRRDVEAVYLIGDFPKRKAARSSVIRSTVPNIGNPASPAGRTGHPHAKPDDLMRDLVGYCPAGVILDPFMGSGTTLRAAKDLGRKAIGIEIDERYCEIAARRMGQEVLDL